MKGKGKVFIYLVLILVLGFSLLYSIRFLTVFQIEKVNVVGLKTWSVEKVANSFESTSWFTIAPNKRRKELMELGYLDNVEFSFQRKQLEIRLEYPESGVVLFLGESPWFYDGEYSEVTPEDAKALLGKYLSVTTPEDFKAYVSHYGFPEDFTEKLEALCYAESLSALITTAEYDNNKHDIYGGILTLRLDDVNALLKVQGTRQKEMVLESIKYIEKEYMDSTDRFAGTVREYVLDGATLTRKKR